MAQVYVYYTDMQDVGEAKKSQSAGEVMAIARRESSRKAKWVDAMKREIKWA